MLYLLGQCPLLHVSVSELCPLHWSPPYEGAGFVQVRRRDVDPTSQVVEQPVHCNQGDHIPSKGQCFIGHLADSALYPLQSAPPWAGVGELHVLFRYWMPSPQDTEHVAQLVHIDHPPSIGHCSWWHDWCSIFVPEQFAPPCNGTGLLHCLCRDLIPLPHVKEHLDQFAHFDHPPCTGQCTRWQSRIVMFCPVQFLPPLEGVGLLHCRWRDSVPLPHVAEHIDHLDHSDQPPSTGQSLTLHPVCEIFLPMQSLPP